jgi:hypothetical protein
MTLSQIGQIPARSAIPTAPRPYDKIGLMKLCRYRLSGRSRCERVEG